MRILDREVGRILVAPLERRHYRAVWKMFATCDGVTHGLDVLRRYAFAAGHYPSRIRLRTPIGPVSTSLYSYHDMLTVNEVFFRQDYESESPQVVVDIGANIGLSALYFLTRNSTCRCYAFEPVPTNVQRLKETLRSFQARYTLREAAVATRAGKLEFGVEPTGRYGGLSCRAQSRIVVETLNINEVLANVLANEEGIDVLKVDTEGTEQELIDAILPEFRSRIRRIFYENAEGVVMTLVFNRREDKVHA